MHMNSSVAAPVVTKSQGRSIIVMGVSGAGKSTLARALADALNLQFMDADDYHPPSNVEKMRCGEALTDEDRAGWLQKLRELLDQADQRQPPQWQGAVLACSALKRRYRETLGVDATLRPLVYIDITRTNAQQRVTRRQSHYMPASLVESQFEALEVPTGAIVVESDWKVGQAVAHVLEQLRLLNAGV
jgi:gluconokinase